MVFEKHVQEATNTYEQLGMKNNQLINEINTSILKIDHAFNQRENQLEAGVGILKDTLSSYVASLEGTLGDKMDHVVRNIAGYIDGTNEGLKREFKELRRIADEGQQSHSRNTQQILQELSREIQTLNQQLYSIGQQAGKWNNGIGLKQNEY